MSSIRLKAKAKSGMINCKALIKHPMETGQRKDKKTGKKVPAHFIEEVVIESGGKNRMTAYWSGAVSKNPFIAVSFAGNPGDTVKLSWTDNKGGSDSAESTIK